MNLFSIHLRMCPYVNAYCVTCRPGDKRIHREKNRGRGQEDMKIEADRQIFHMSHCSLGPGPDVTRTVFIC